MLDNLSSILPLIQMLSGNNKNLNMGDMLKNMAGGGNNDMLSSLTSLMGNKGGSGSANMADLLKNMTGGSGDNGNMLSMLPYLMQMMNKQNTDKQNQTKTSPVIENIENEQKFYNLKPISKIANKDITYMLNQYFAVN